MRELAALRRSSGQSNKSLCAAIGIKQPVTFYGWEKGTSRPTLPNLTAYVQAVGGDVDTVLESVTVGGSRLDRVWESQYRAAPRNRVRPYVRLAELSADDLEFFEDRDDVELTPEHYASDPVNRYIASRRRAHDAARLLSGRGFRQPARRHPVRDRRRQYRRSRAGGSPRVRARVRADRQPPTRSQTRV